MKTHLNTHLRVAPVVFAILLAGCSLVPGGSNPPDDDVLKELAAHQAQWLAKAVDDYTFTITRQCFCPGTDPIDITVVDGVVAAAQKAGQPVPRADMIGLPTNVGELFAIVAAQAEAADAITVEWDPVFGFPTSIQIDAIANAIDDEMGYTVTNFRPAS